MTSDVNSSPGNTTGSGDAANPFVLPDGVVPGGSVSGISPPQQGSTSQIQEDTISTSTQQSNATTPDTANPKLTQPEVNQMLLSSDAFRSLLMQNLIQINSFSSTSPKNMELMSKLYGMDESMLRSISNNNMNFSSNEVELMFNNKINEIISDSWSKFNEVIDELNRRDQEWLRSGAKQYQDLINSSEYHSKASWDSASPEERTKINQGAAEFEVFLDSLPPGDKDRFLASGEVPDTANNYLMSNNVKAFGNAYEAASPIDGNSNNTNIVLTTVMTNAGGIMSHGSYALPITPEQANINMIRDGMMAAQNAVPMVGFDANTAATLGYLGAMLASTTMLLSSFENVLSTKAQGRTASEGADLQFAKRYAYNLTAFVKSPGFEAGIMAIVTQRYEGSEPLNQDQKAEIVSRLRVLMLSNALALLFNASGANVNGVAWRDAVENPSSVANDPQMGEYAYSLALDIKQNLPSDTGVRSALMDQLQTFFDGAPGSRELLETNTALKGAFLEEPMRPVSD